VADRIFRHVVPIDDQAHTIETAMAKRLDARPVRVEARGDNTVEFWMPVGDGPAIVPRTFQVFGTGQPIPETACYHGTTSRSVPGGFVWDLIELTGPR
jgi:hypothetical protein